MKEFSMKKSILMLTALFVLGACSTTGSDDTTTDGGTGGGDSLSAEATAFLALVGGQSKEDYDAQSAKEGDWVFSNDGKILTVYADVSGTVTGAEYSFDADSVGGNATDGYTADYGTHKVTATVEEDGSLKEIDIQSN